MAESVSRMEDKALEDVNQQLVIYLQTNHPQLVTDTTVPAHDELKQMLEICAGDIDVIISYLLLFDAAGRQFDKIADLLPAIIETRASSSARKAGNKRKSSSTVIPQEFQEVMLGYLSSTECRLFDDDNQLVVSKKALNKLLATGVKARDLVEWYKTLTKHHDGIFESFALSVDALLIFMASDDGKHAYAHRIAEQRRSKKAALKKERQASISWTKLTSLMKPKQESRSAIITVLNEVDIFEDAGQEIKITKQSVDNLTWLCEGSDTVVQVLREFEFKRRRFHSFDELCDAIEVWQDHQEEINSASQIQRVYRAHLKRKRDAALGLTYDEKENHAARSIQARFRYHKHRRGAHDIPEEAPQGLVSRRYTIDAPEITPVDLTPRTIAQEEIDVLVAYLSEECNLFGNAEELDVSMTEVDRLINKCETGARAVEMMRQLDSDRQQYSTFAAAVDAVFAAFSVSKKMPLLPETLLFDVAEGDEEKAEEAQNAKDEEVAAQAIQVRYRYHAKRKRRKERQAAEAAAARERMEAEEQAAAAQTIQVRYRYHATKKERKERAERKEAEAAVERARLEREEQVAAAQAIQVRYRYHAKSKERNERKAAEAAAERERMEAEEQAAAAKAIQVKYRYHVKSKQRKERLEAEAAAERGRLEAALAAQEAQEQQQAALAIQSRYRYHAKKKKKRKQVSIVNEPQVQHVTVDHIQKVDRAEFDDEKEDLQDQVVSGIQETKREIHAARAIQVRYRYRERSRSRRRRKSQSSIEQADGLSEVPGVLVVNECGGGSDTEPVRREHSLSNSKTVHFRDDDAQSEDKAARAIQVRYRYHAKHKKRPTKTTLDGDTIPRRSSGKRSSNRTRSKKKRMTLDGELLASALEKSAEKKEPAASAPETVRVAESMRRRTSVPDMDGGIMPVLMRQPTLDQELLGELNPALANKMNPEDVAAEEPSQVPTVTEQSAASITFDGENLGALLADKPVDVDVTIADDVEDEEPLLVSSKMPDSLEEGAPETSSPFRVEDPEGEERRRGSVSLEPLNDKQFGKIMSPTLRFSGDRRATATELLNMMSADDLMPSDALVNLEQSDDAVEEPVVSSVPAISTEDNNEAGPREFSPMSPTRTLRARPALRPESPTRMIRGSSVQEDYAPRGPGVSITSGREQEFVFDLSDNDDEKEVVVEDVIVESVSKSVDGDPVETKNVSFATDPVPVLTNSEHTDLSVDPELTSEPLNLLSPESAAAISAARQDLQRTSTIPDAATPPVTRSSTFAGAYAGNESDFDQIDEAPPGIMLLPQEDDFEQRYAEALEREVAAARVLRAQQEKDMILSNARKAERRAQQTQSRQYKALVEEERKILGRSGVGNGIDLNAWAWSLLWHPKARLRVLIPDTILFVGNSFAGCIFTSQKDNGEVRKNTRLDDYEDGMYRRILRKSESLTNITPFRAVVESQDSTLSLLSDDEMQSLLWQEHGVSWAQNANTPGFHRRVSAYVHPMLGLRYVTSYKKTLASEAAATSMRNKASNAKNGWNKYGGSHTQPDVPASTMATKTLSFTSKYVVPPSEEMHYASSLRPASDNTFPVPDSLRKQCERLTQRIVDYMERVHYDKLGSTGIVRIQCEFVQDFKKRVVLTGISHLVLAKGVHPVIQQPLTASSSRTFRYGSRSSSISEAASLPSSAESTPRSRSKRRKPQSARKRATPPSRNSPVVAQQEQVQHATSALLNDTIPVSEHTIKSRTPVHAWSNESKKPVISRAERMQRKTSQHRPVAVLQQVYQEREQVRKARPKQFAETRTEADLRRSRGKTQPQGRGPPKVAMNRKISPKKKKKKSTSTTVSQADAEKDFLLYHYRHVARKSDGEYQVMAQDAVEMERGYLDEQEQLRAAMEENDERTRNAESSHMRIQDEIEMLRKQREEEEQLYLAQTQKAELSLQTLKETVQAKESIITSLTELHNETKRQLAESQERVEILAKMRDDSVEAQGLVQSEKNDIVARLGAAERVREQLVKKLETDEAALGLVSRNLDLVTDWERMERMSTMFSDIVSYCEDEQKRMGQLYEFKRIIDAHSGDDGDWMANKNAIILAFHQAMRSLGKEKHTGKGNSRGIGGNSVGGVRSFARGPTAREAVNSSNAKLTADIIAERRRFKMNFSKVEHDVSLQKTI